MLYNIFFKGAGNAYECIIQIAVKKWNFNQKLSNFIVWKGRRKWKRETGRHCFPYSYLLFYI